MNVNEDDATTKPQLADQSYAISHSQSAASSGTMTPEELRGWVGRTLLAQDARWVADIVHSTRNSEANFLVGLLITHHFVRIAYEGALAIRSPNPLLGQPQLASLLRDKYSLLTAKARHVSKVLDDNKKSLEEIHSELRAAYERNREVFRTNRRGILGPLRTDLGLYLMNGRVVGATIPMAYRLGLGAGDQHLMSGEILSDVTSEWGSTIAILASADLQPPIEGGTLKIDQTRVATSDKRTSSWLSRRFDTTFSLETKLLLLMIEADINCCQLFLPMVEPGHEMPVFRARVVTLYHSLTAIQRIVESHTHDSPRMDALRELLADDITKRLVSWHGKQVRNRCVHYELKSARISPDLNEPMFGLVEAVFTGSTVAQFDRDVRDISCRLSDLLHAWKT